MFKWKGVIYLLHHNLNFYNNIDLYLHLQFNEWQNKKSKFKERKRHPKQQQTYCPEVNTIWVNVQFHRGTNFQENTTHPSMLYCFIL